MSNEMLNNFQKTAEEPAPSVEETPSYEEAIPKETYQRGGAIAGGVAGGSVGGTSGLAMQLDNVGKPWMRAAAPIAGAGLGALVGRYGVATDDNYEKGRESFNKQVENNPDLRRHLVEQQKMKEKSASEGEGPGALPVAANMVGAATTPFALGGPAFNTIADTRSDTVGGSAEDFGTRALHVGGKSLLGGLGGGVAGSALGAAAGGLLGGGPGALMGASMGGGPGALAGSLYGNYKGTESSEKAIDEKYEGQKEDEQDSDGGDEISDEEDKTAAVLAEYFESMQPAKEAVRQIDRGVPVGDVTEKLANEGHISEEEADYLHALGEKVASLTHEVVDGADIEKAKEASMSKTASSEERLSKEAKGRIGNMIGQAADFAQKNQGALTAAGVGIPAALIAGESVGQGLRSAADPLIEQYRFSNMMGLPGKKTHKKIKGQRGPDSNLPERYGVPKEENGEPISSDERHRRAVRKAFEIMHDNAPELSAQPEVARSFITDQMSSPPHEFMDTAMRKARGRVQNDVSRERMKSDRRGRLESGAHTMAEAANAIGSQGGA